MMLRQNTDRHHGGTEMFKCPYFGSMQITVLYLSLWKPCIDYGTVYYVECNITDSGVHRVRYMVQYSTV